MSSTVKLKIHLLGDDPIIQFIGEGRLNSNNFRDHGQHRRDCGKIYVKTGFVFMENEGAGYFYHPITKETKNRLHFD
jgi:hypothetical protein